MMLSFLYFFTSYIFLSIHFNENKRKKNKEKFYINT